MDFLVILVLTLLNGAFAMSELALTASKKVRLQTMAEEGDKGAQAALDLLANPTQFLSVVQVGITGIGMLNAVVGEAAFGDGLRSGWSSPSRCHTRPRVPPPRRWWSPPSPSSRFCLASWCPSA